MANKAFVYAIQPNADQIIQCQKTFGSCRFVYNHMLDIQKKRYKDGETYLSKFNANTYCNHNLKTEYPFLKEIDKFALTNAIYHLSDGYDKFFKRLGGLPKYKSKRKARRSYTTNFTNNNIEVGDDHVKLPKLGKFKQLFIAKHPKNGKLSLLLYHRTEMVLIKYPYFMNMSKIN
jgi:putative transposase